MSIHEIIFFTHPQSKGCYELHQLLTQYNISAKYFNIASKQAASVLKKGKYFKVNHVPSLVVAFDDGNIKKFEGENCKKFIEYMISENDERSENESDEFIDNDDESEDDDFETFEDEFQNNDSLLRDNGRLNIQEAMQRAEDERAALEEQADPKLRKRKRV